MSKGITVKVEGDQSLMTKLRKLGSPDVYQAASEAAGIEANQLLRDHFYRLHGQRGRPDGSGFYRDAADLTFHRVVDDGVYVGTAKTGVRQRRHGGRITPRESKLLTIPVHPAAYNVRARDSSLPELSLIPTGTPGVLILAHTGQGGFFVPYYVLVPEVYQDPDPTVLPNRDEFSAAALRGIRGAMRRQLNN